MFSLFLEYFIHVHINGITCTDKLEQRCYTIQFKGLKRKAAYSEYKTSLAKRTSLYEK